MSSVIKRLSWALAISFGLNLFLLGYGAARAWRERDAASHVLREHHPLSEVLGPPSPELRAQHEALREARRAVAEALQAEPYDRERTEQALEALRARVIRSQELLHRRLIDKAGELSPAQRRELASHRYERHRGRRPRGEDRSGPP